MGNTIMLNTAILDGGVIIKRSGGGTQPAPTPNMPVIGDGKTYLYIKIAEKGRMTVPLYFSQTVAKGVIIDWGDGSATQALSGTGNKYTSHTYAEIGEYVISLNPTNGCVLGLGHNSSSYCVLGGSGYGTVYRNMLQAVEIGIGVASIGSYAFQQCYTLKSVVIPEGVTSIGSYVFSECYSLVSIVILEGVTSIGNNAFSGCKSLASIVIPQSVTSIGDYAFNYCEGMAIFDFSQCESVPTLGGSSVFYNVKTDCKIVVPDSLYDSWVAATNWSKHASKIVKASEFNA